MSQTTSFPNVSVALVPSQQLVGLTPQRILVIGQQVASATATTGVLVENIQNDNSWDTLFGQNSQIAGAIRKVRALNTKTDLDAIPLDDNGSGVAAAGDFGVTGTATAAGSITLTVFSEEDFDFEVPVAVGDTASVFIAAAVAIINAVPKTLPGTASDGGTTIDIVADNDGTIGNSFALKKSGTVAGLVVTITAMSGGLLDPSFTGLFDVIKDRRYQTIIWPYFADVDTIKDFLDDRFNVNDDVLDGVGHIGTQDTFAAALALANTHNSQSIVLNGDETVSRDDLEGGAITEIPYARNAQIAAIDALGLTDGAPFSRFVIGRGAKDRFGGPHIASLPYANREIPDLPLVQVQDGFEKEEILDLGDAGYSVSGNNKTNTLVTMNQMFTTYKTDSAGNPDITWKFLNYVRTSSNIREFIFNNLKDEYAQSRLTEGAITPGFSETNQVDIENFIGSLYSELADIVLVVSGEAAVQFFSDNLIVTLDLSTGTVFVEMVTPIIVQLRVMLATIRIEFTVEGN